MWAAGTGTQSEHPQPPGAETIAWFCLVPAAAVVRWPGKAVSKLKGAGDESGQTQEALP